MDPIAFSVVTVLGKYALDKGLELSRDVGPKALEMAEKMFGMVLERIGRKKPEMAADFSNDPEIYEKPMERAVATEVDADPDFKAKLGEMLSAYEAAASEHRYSFSQTVTTRNHSSVATDKGIAIAGNGNFVVTHGVKGDMTVHLPRNRES